MTDTTSPRKPEAQHLMGGPVSRWAHPLTKVDHSSKWGSSPELTSSCRMPSAAGVSGVDGSEMVLLCAVLYAAEIPTCSVKIRKSHLQYVHTYKSSTHGTQDARLHMSHPILCHVNNHITHLGNK